MAKVQKKDERRKLSRKNFTYYMRVMDEVSGKFIGQLVDISTGGFKVESAHEIPLNQPIKLRIDQTGEISDRSYIVFMGMAKWCQQDTYDLSVYNIGFQITEMLLTVGFKNVGYFLTGFFFNQVVCIEETSF